jgi:Ca-activated chloride channel family protein
MNILLTTLAAIVLAALAEWLHVRRCRRVARLAFGPSGKPREWTRIVPWARVAAMGALAWGLVTLLYVGPRATRSQKMPEGGYRHLVLALDVSPSMQLQDAGQGAKQTRAKRASEVIMSLLQRVATDQVRVSIVAFYTDAKPVVIDTFDMEVVKNALNDLPLDIAFDVGKTTLLQGIRQSAEIAKGWQPDSTTLIVVSDGDTIPDSGMPEVPRSIQRILILGVGDARSGRFIDGHQSRQDASTLRQLAKRLRGDYFDANEKHLSSDFLTALSRMLPLRDVRQLSRRELALLAVGVGGFVLATIPIALALAGSAWQTRAESKKAPTRSRPLDAALAVNKKEQEKMNYA